MMCIVRSRPRSNQKDSNAVELQSDSDNWNEWVEAAQSRPKKHNKKVCYLAKTPKDRNKERATPVQKYEQDNAWSKLKEFGNQEPRSKYKRLETCLYSGRIHELSW